MSFAIPIGATVIVHRAGLMNQRYIFRGGDPEQFEDEKGNFHLNPFDAPYVGVTITDPDTGESVYHSPRP